MEDKLKLEKLLEILNNPSQYSQGQVYQACKLAAKLVGVEQITTVQSAATQSVENVQSVLASTLKEYDDLKDQFDNQETVFRNHCAISAMNALIMIETQGERDPSGGVIARKAFSIAQAMVEEKRRLDE